MARDHFPKRIVCLTEESTELLYLLGEEDRIVGISGFTMRPLRARKEKPKVSAFIDAKIEEILALKPDLVIGYSDIQANIAQQLISKGLTVLINNHNSVQGICDFIVQLGALVGKADEARKLVTQYMAEIEQISINVSDKPRVYFEEWFEPLIFGSRWVSELIIAAGGEDIFSELQPAPLGKQRIISDPDEVIRRNPDIIIASWCGKKFKKDKMLGRPGWDQINAVKHDRIYEIKSECILQPGPASLTDGFRMLKEIILQYQEFS